MAKRKFNRCLLIVCEGTKTEHDYFDYITSHVSRPKGIWDNVVICDNKTIPKDFPIPEPTELGIRKKRSFVNPNKQNMRERNVLKELCVYLYGEGVGIDEYENIKAVPLRYVAQAQLIEEEQRMYEELWAVFDMDGHSHHKQAFERAKKEVNGKKVQIGFTSRSFEHWILLHFKKNRTQFSSSECKDEKRKSLNFNSEQGCKGTICLAGYLRSFTPLKNYEKSNSADNLGFMMKLLLDPQCLNSAFANAEWLRKEIKNDENLKDKNCYELNPYTDVDILVKKLVE